MEYIVEGHVVVEWECPQCGTSNTSSYYDDADIIRDCSNCQKESKITVRRES